MKNDPLNSPLTVEEKEFAAENHYLIEKYLKIRHLPHDDWYDVAVFRYLRSVKRWFAIPELQKHSFEIIAFYAMRSAIGGELTKQERRIKTVSLDEVIPGTDGITYADSITHNNLKYINYEKGGKDMKLKYDVKLPERKTFRGAAKSDEIIAIEGFLQMKDKKNMCFEYDTPDEAKKKLAAVGSYRRNNKQKELYEVYRDNNCVYIVRVNPEKK